VFFFHPPRKGDFLVAGFDLTQKKNKIEFLDTLNSSTNTQIRVATGGACGMWRFLEALWFFSLFCCSWIELGLQQSMWDVEVSRNIDYLLVAFQGDNRAPIATTSFFNPLIYYEARPLLLLSAGEYQWWTCCAEAEGLFWLG
jgi:hypothetical protein